MDGLQVLFRILMYSGRVVLAVSLIVVSKPVATAFSARKGYMQGNCSRANHIIQSLRSVYARGRYRIGVKIVLEIRK